MNIKPSLEVLEHAANMLERRINRREAQGKPHSSHLEYAYFMSVMDVLGRRFEDMRRDGTFDEFVESLTDSEREQFAALADELQRLLDEAQT